MILYLNCHPRVEGLTNSVSKSFDNMYHFRFLFTLVFVIFAFLRRRTFGAAVPYTSRSDSSSW